MNRRHTLRFDTAALRECAGEKVFARGETYFRNGSVSLLAVDRKRVLAHVAGTEDYRVELTGRGDVIDGECSCPAFEDWGFCKHMVATALAANAAGEEAETEGGDTGALATIREYLKAKGVDALAEMIADFAERDPALFRRLELASAAATTHGDEKLAARFERLIDSAIATGGFVDYHEAAGWAEGVQSALDALAEIATGARANVALRLAERAIDRIELAIDEIDDSDGHCTLLLERAREIHLDAARAVHPEPLTFARALFARETAGEWGTFDGAVKVYAGVLGESGLVEYRRLANAAWEKLAFRSSRGGRRADPPVVFHRLAAILDFFAEADGDVDARIALRARDLSCALDYMRLAEFCLAQGRQDDALKWGEEGLWMFEDERPEERLVFFVVDLLQSRGRTEDAATHLWRAFERSPNLAVYERLRKTGEAVFERAAARLEARMAKEKRTQWYFPADVFVSVLIRESMFDRAWSVAHENGVSTAVREALARASAKTHPREALAVYAERVEALASGSGGNRAYEEAAKLVAGMASLRRAAEQQTYVADLKARFGRRRNFVKLLG